MTRRGLSALLAALLAAPALGAPVEVTRVPAAAAGLGGVSAAGAAVTVSAAPAVAGLNAAPSAPAPLLAPAAALTAAPAPAALPNAAPAAAPARAPVTLGGGAVQAGPITWSFGPDARGPPAAPRTFASAAATVARTVRSWGAPVEAIFAAHDVLLVGENHGSLESVQTLTREMPRLAAAGVTAIGIEGLKRPHQQAVDAWLDGRSGVFPEAALDFSPKRREAFRDLFHAARRDGVRLVALGIPLDEWARAASDLAARQTGRPASAFPADVNGHFERAGTRYEEGYNEAVAEVFLTRRNESMAAFLAQSLAEGGKAVALVGQAHVEGLDTVAARLMNAPGEWGTLAGALAARMLKAFSLTQTGGVFVSADAAALDRSARPGSYRKVSETGPDGRPHYVPLGPDRGLWHSGGRVPPRAPIH